MVFLEIKSKSNNRYILLISLIYILVSSEFSFLILIEGTKYLQVFQIFTIPYLIISIIIIWLFGFYFKERFRFLIFIIGIALGYIIIIYLLNSQRDFYGIILLDFILKSMILGSSLLAKYFYFIITNKKNSKTDFSFENQNNDQFRKTRNFYTGLHVQDIYGFVFFFILNPVFVLIFFT